MKVALYQSYPRLGDIEGNTKNLIEKIKQAKKEGAHLFVSPELAICGYYVRDLLLHKDFYLRCVSALEEFKAIYGITIIIGAPRLENKKHYNSAFIFRDGEIIGIYDKQILPNYDIFDEKRYFTGGDKPFILECEGKKIGLLICEDMWDERPTNLLPKLDLICVMNASPYREHQADNRKLCARERVNFKKVPLIYLNCVGGQDELVFDGASFVLDAKGEYWQLFPSFEEKLSYFEMDVPISNYSISDDPVRDCSINDCSIRDCLTISPVSNAYLDKYNAIIMGLRDYVKNSGFTQVVLGLSGGIDSALVLVLAVHALGAENVFAVMMPSDFTSKESHDDARQLIENLKVRSELIVITPMFSAYKASLAPLFEGKGEDLTEENLQARIRGMLLMAISNKLGHMVLVTSNKSEIATGFGTLYGDMAGGFAPIKDLYKTEVFELCRQINRLHNDIIPQSILNKAPSAELRHNQTDQDLLPEYDLLDKILREFIENKHSSKEIIAHGLSQHTVDKVYKLLKQSEYKRHQGVMGVKLSICAFGSDWRYPVTSKSN